MFEYGDMLWMTNQSYGDTLYMVVRPPIVCEHCGFHIKDWEPNEENEVYCPECKEQIEKFDHLICNCGEDDFISVVVASNNNFCGTSDGDTMPYNHMVNKVSSFCKKSLIEDIRKGRIRYLSPEEAVYRKRLLVWTNQAEYDPGKAMPQWIIDQFPMP